MLTIILWKSFETFMGPSRLRRLKGVHESKGGRVEKSFVCFVPFSHFSSQGDEEGERGKKGKNKQLLLIAFDDGGKIFLVPNAVENSISTFVSRTFEWYITK